MPLDPLEKFRVTANVLRCWFGAPIRLELAVVVGLPAVALAVVMSPWTEYRAALAADRQRALPEVKAAAVKTALPWLLGR